ncbi:hypothetical protein ACFL7D_09120 [candidate division KSB1 bacterium]
MGELAVALPFAAVFGAESFYAAPLMPLGQAFAVHKANNEQGSFGRTVAGAYGSFLFYGIIYGITRKYVGGLLNIESNFRAQTFGMSILGLPIIFNPVTVRAQQKW